MKKTQTPSRRFRLAPALLVLLGCVGGYQADGAPSTKLLDAKIEGGVTPALRKKVAGLVLAKEPQVGRTAERIFVEKMGKVAKETSTIPFFLVVPGEDRKDREKTKALLEAAGVDGLVVFRLLEKDETVEVNDSTIAKQAWNNMLWHAYGAWYGPGTGVYWGADLNSASVRRNYALIEAALYTVDDAKLVWTARTKTVDAKSVEEVLESVCGDIASALKKAKLVE